MPLPFDATLKSIVADHPGDFAEVFGLPSDEPVTGVNVVCQLPAGEPLPSALHAVVQEIHRRLGKETSHAEAVRLMTAAYILTGLRVKKADLASIYRGVGLMNESTAYDEAVEEGELKNSHRLLLRLGQKKFGEPDAALEAELKSIRDLDRLERFADAILTAQSWQELLATK